MPSSSLAWRKYGLYLLRDLTAIAIIATKRMCVTPFKYFMQTEFRRIELWLWWLTTSRTSKRKACKWDNRLSHKIIFYNVYSITFNTVSVFTFVFCSAKNPTKGVIVARAEGPNVYEGVPKDYIGRHVTKRNFEFVLRGDREKMRGRGSGKVRSLWLPWRK